MPAALMAASQMSRRVALSSNDDRRQTSHAKILLHAFVDLSCCSRSGADNQLPKGRSSLCLHVKGQVMSYCQLLGVQ